MMRISLAHDCRAYFFGAILSLIQGKTEYLFFDGTINNV